MSKLSQLAGKPQEFTIGPISLTLKPRGMKDLDLFMAMQDKHQQASSMMKLIKVTLKDAVPDATDEEIDAIVVGEHLENLTTAILKVNGFDDTKLRTADRGPDKEDKQ